MTREEFYLKYGDIKVKFLSYYKYTFMYKAILPDGKILTCMYGGDSDTIYRHEVVIDGEEILRSLHPYSGSVYQGGIEIEGFYAY